MSLHLFQKAIWTEAKPNVASSLKCTDFVLTGILRVWRPRDKSNFGISLRAAFAASGKKGEMNNFIVRKKGEEENERGQGGMNKFGLSI